MRYDAFISYSHAADDQLAPAIQRGLQRLARRWYRPRALDVFRDQTGLAVSPHMWASIARALDDARWFVVLCSPEAAKSEWVDREIRHWLAQHSHDRILLVLTDGELVWDRGQGAFDSSGSSALPGALFGQFDDEPRYLDLRWARREEQLDLRHTRFRQAVGELAAPMHDVARDELEAEDVRQHRRTVRLARGATTVVILLLVMALALGALALQQRSEARRQAVNARREANAAKLAAAGVLGRSLAAQSLNALEGGQSDLAQLLAIEAYRTDPSPYSRSSLLQAVVSQPALEIELHGLESGPGLVSISSGGDIVAADGEGGPMLWDRNTGQPLILGSKGADVDVANFAESGRLAIARLDGSASRVGVWDVAANRELTEIGVRPVWAASESASTLVDLDGAGVLRVIDLKTGDTIRSWSTPQAAAFPSQANTLAISADGKAVAEVSALSTPELGSRLLVSFHVWSTATGHETGNGCSADTAQYPALGGFGSDRASSSRGPMVLADDKTIAFAATASDQQGASTGAIFKCDPATGTIASQPFRGVASGLSRDGRTIAVRTSDTSIQLQDTISGKSIGEPVDAPLTQRMGFSQVVFSADGRWFTATGSDGPVRVWRTRPELPLARRSAFDSSGFEQAHSGQTIRLTTNGDVVDVNTGQTLRQFRDPSRRRDQIPLVDLSNDGRYVTGMGANGLTVVDLHRRTTRSVPARALACDANEGVAIAPDNKTLMLSCGANAAREVIEAVDISSEPWRIGPRVEASVLGGGTFSPDGKMYALGSAANASSGLQIFDVRGSHLKTRKTFQGDAYAFEFTSDSRTLLWGGDGSIQSVAVGDGSFRAEPFAPAADNPTQFLALSEDGSLLAASDWGMIRLWDVRTEQVIGDLPGLSEPTCCDVIAATKNSVTAISETSYGPNGEATGDIFQFKFDLDPEHLIRRACARANRNLSRSEWTQVVGAIPFRTQCPQRAEPSPPRPAPRREAPATSAPKGTQPSTSTSTSTPTTTSTTASESRIPNHHANIDITGDDRCFNYVTAALDLLESEAPAQFTLVRKYEATLECLRERGGVNVLPTPPHIVIDTDTIYGGGPLWIAGDLGNSFAIIDLYRRYELAHPGQNVPIDIWTGSAAQGEALTVQAKILEELGATQAQIDYVNGLIPRDASG